MRNHGDIDRIARTIRSASTSIEERFVDIGDRLETSVALLNALTTTFDTLKNELQSENLRQATNDLSQVAARVSALARSRGSVTGSFDKLAKLTVTVRNHIVQMAGSVGEVRVLATNAKIAAAYIDDPDGDFMNFAVEITRTLEAARVDLDAFDAELKGVGHLLRASTSARSALEQRESETADAILSRLEHSMEAISVRRERASAAALAVAGGSRRIGKRIADAVAALQIGDVTRQRIEHVNFAMGLLAELAAAPTAQDPWRALAATQRETLSDCCSWLQSAQLTDSADRFDSEVQQVLQSLHDLLGDAREILGLGNDAFGAAGGRVGTFLGELEEHVGAVNIRLGGLRQAERDAEQVATSVSEATTRLVDHIRNVRSLEGDICIMGLNMSFRCGRLGVAGRPLSVIAQELRLYARKIAVEAADVMTELDKVVTAASELSDRSQEGVAADVSSVTEIMANALFGLKAAGQNLADAWKILKRDGDVVAGVLQETVARTHVHEEVGRVLRQAAGELIDGLPDTSGDPGDIPPEANRMSELIAHSYTMEAERAVLMRRGPGWLQFQYAEALPAPGPSKAAAEFDDIFF